MQTLPTESARHTGEEMVSRVFEKTKKNICVCTNSRASTTGFVSQMRFLHGGFVHHLHAVLRAHKSLLCALPGEEDTFQRAARCLREHRSMTMLTRHVSFATEQEVDCVAESLLHLSMEEHCWTVVAGVAKQVQEWAADLAENCSADVSCQLSTLKQRHC